ncbi:hypothetical protein [Helicobacter sp. T3_23-1059]
MINNDKKPKKCEIPKHNARNKTTILARFILALLILRYNTRILIALKPHDKHKIYTSKYCAKSSIKSNQKPQNHKVAKCYLSY